MRIAHLMTLAMAFCFCAAKAEETADSAREKGITALKESQTDSKKVVAAARAFAKAAALYAAAGETEKAVETNSFLYWCKKKMTLQDIDEFFKAEGSAPAKQLEEIAKTVPADEAGIWLSRADDFAKNNPNEHLLIAVRFFEVADRFKGIPEGFTALDRSLKEMQLSGSKAPLPPVHVQTEPAKSASGKAQVPEAAKVLDAQKAIRATFKDEFASLKPEDRQALVEKLTETAAATPGATLDKYAVLIEARDQALASGNTTLALKSWDELNTLFELDSAETANALKRVGTTGKVEEYTLFACCSLALHAAEQWIANNQVEKLQSLNPVLQSLLSKLPTTRSYTAAFKARSLPILEALKEWPTCKSSLEKLRSKPEDPAANLAVGRFYCFERGDWSGGLPALARGSDAALKLAAEKEIAAPTETPDQIALADSWSDCAKKLPPSQRSAVESHALEWYERGAASVTGLTKLRVDKRIAELRTAESAPAIPPVVVLNAKCNTDEKEADVTTFYQKEFDTNPFAAIYGFGPAQKRPSGHNPRITAKLLIDGRVENITVKETELYLAPFWKNGLPIQSKQFKILNSRVSAANNWLDKTDVTIQLAKTPKTYIDIQSVWNTPLPTDPWPYVHKSVVMWFELNGRRYARHFEESYKGFIEP